MQAAAEEAALLVQVRPCTPASTVAAGFVHQWVLPSLQPTDASWAQAYGHCSRLSAVLSASRIQHEQTALRTRVQDLLNAATAVATPLLGTDAFNNSLRYAKCVAAVMSTHTLPTWSPASRHSRPATASKSRPFAIPLSGLQPDLVKAVAHIAPSQGTDAAQMGQAGPVPPSCFHCVLGISVLQHQP